MLTDVQTVPEEGTVIVTLEKAKKHLRIEEDYTEEDEIIQGCIDGAVEASENYLNGSISKKKMVITMDRFDSPLVFEAFPLRGVESVKYFTPDSETEAEMEVALYRLTNQTSKVYQLRFLSETPQTAKRFDAVTVEIKVGFETGKVPNPIISAILLQIGDLYERREDRGEIGYNAAAANLLRPYRKP